MLQTLTDTLTVLTQCYATAMGVSPMWNIEPRVIDTIPELYAVVSEIRDATDSTQPRATITYNRLTMQDLPDEGRRIIVVHELEHVYWSSVQAAAKWAAQEYGTRISDPTIMLEMRRLIENLTDKRSKMPMWQKMCGHRGKP